MVDTNEDQFIAMLDGVITKLGMLGVEDLSDSRENGDVPPSCEDTTAGQMKRKAKNFQVHTIGTVGTVVLSRHPELVN